MSNDAKLKEVLEAIAPLLEPLGWTPYKKDDWYVWQLNHSSGANVYIRYDRERLKFNPGWPFCQGWGSFKPAVHVDAITIGATRMPADIVKDLSRRLLTPYVPQYAEATEIMETHQQRMNAITRCTKSLAAILNAEVSSQSGTNPIREFRHFDHFSVDGRVNSPESIELHFRWVSIKQAEELLQLAARWGNG